MSESPPDSPPQVDKNILSVLKKLEEIERECGDGDIGTYKTNIRNLFEQLLNKLEENNDQIYALHHRIKYLEQECESKDLHIEKITIAMQEAVDECRIEAEDLVDDMSKKITQEVLQRREVERIVCRLQVENSQLKDTLRIHKLPGLEQNLDQLIEEIRQNEAAAYQENVQELHNIIHSKEEEYEQLKEQREVEMKTMISIIKIAQQKIETFEHQMKVHVQTLNTMREKEEKAKRSPIIFAHPPVPGSRELYVHDSDTLSSSPPNDLSPPQKQTQQESTKYQDKGKTVVPYKKRNNRGKKKGVGANSNSASTLNSDGKKDSNEKNGITSRIVLESESTESTKSPPATPPRESQQSVDQTSNSETSQITISPSLSRSVAAVEHREKTSAFWSNIRLSL